MVCFFIFVGTDKHSAEMTDSSTLMDLMKEVENKTGVPINGQKIIFNGKSMTSLDHEKNLSDLRFKDGCKVMILGKHFSCSTMKK